ncbi:TPA_asm: hypothetical protein G1Q02_25425 [Salmonella enterica subsp. enterica serovar Typhimurium]|nr:hypothetical protein [Salmonella enterica subsp. enterica serovar Typhimurium]
MFEFIMGAVSGFLFDFLDKKKISNKKLIVFSFFSNALLFLSVFLLGYFFNKTEVGFYIGFLLSVGIGFIGAVSMFLHKKFSK